jgi:hypothetical protein
MTEDEIKCFKPLSDWYYIIYFLETRIDELHKGPCDPNYNYSNDREWMEDVLWQGQDIVEMNTAIENVNKFSNLREAHYAEWMTMEDGEDKINKLKEAESNGIRRDRATIQILVNLKYKFLKKYGFYTTKGVKKFSMNEKCEDKTWWNALESYIRPVEEHILDHNKVNYYEDINRKIWYTNARKEVELSEEQIKNIPVYDINYRQTDFEHDTIIFCQYVDQEKDKDWIKSVTHFIIGKSWYKDFTKTKDQWYIIRNEGARRCARFPKEFKIEKDGKSVTYTQGKNCIEDPEGMWVGLSQPAHPEDQRDKTIVNSNGDTIGYTRHLYDWGWSIETYEWIREKFIGKVNNL